MLLHVMVVESGPLKDRSELSATGQSAELLTVAGSMVWPSQVTLTYSLPMSGSCGVHTGTLTWVTLLSPGLTQVTCFPSSSGRGPRLQKGTASSPVWKPQVVTMKGSVSPLLGVHLGTSRGAFTVSFSQCVTMKS